LTDDQEALRAAARKFTAEVLTPAMMDVERQGIEFPNELLRQMGSLGFLGLDVPEEYGGQAFDTLTCAVIQEEIAAASFCASAYPTSLAAGPIIVAGTEEQKCRILPGLCAGECVLSFALTEPDGGSDAAAISTFAARDGDHYVINGRKMFITNARRADVLVTFVRTDKNAPRGEGISILLVDKGAPGLTIGPAYRVMGHSANPIADVIFEDCRVPAANLIGVEGKGFEYIQSGLSKIRAVYGSRCVGVAQGAIDYALRYAQERKQFSKPIASFQGIRFKVADIVTRIEAARHLCYRAAAISDRRTADAPAAAAMAKHFAADTAVQAVSDAIQMMGGHGLIADHPLERHYREAKLFQIGDGNSEVLRVLISRFANRRATASLPARLD
jgi:alkylation response protein AidB-like acyl-CoA dehydrogenase